MIIVARQDAVKQWAVKKRAFFGHWRRDLLRTPAIALIPDGSSRLDVDFCSLTMGGDYKQQRHRRRSTMMQCSYHRDGTAMPSKCIVRFLNYRRFPTMHFVRLPATIPQKTLSRKISRAGQQMQKKRQRRSTDISILGRRSPAAYSRQFEAFHHRQGFSAETPLATLCV